MHADHTGHDRPKHKTPEYFYDTPFSLIAFMLALMMIIPIPRVMPTPEARADGANGVCEQICSGSICGISDPNDPDCAIGCACNDGTTVLIIGIPDVNTCNTSATCQNHGGWVGGGGELGGCGSLEFFNGGTVCSADVHAVDPDTGAVLVNESLFAGQQLGALERQAIDDVLTLHGLPAADKDRLLAWGRDRVRAQLFAKLVDIINKPATERTANEQVLYNWLTNIVWQKRIEPAQKAWEQYLAWNNAVEFATCSWQPPNKVVWQPKWLTATDDPQLVSCQADVNLGGQTAQRLCQINGCSPGNDGIPRTDPTPNSAGNPLNPNDDGEICFASGSLTYDACTLSRCAGTPALPGCSVAIPAHPSYEQFKGYGATLARKNFVYNPSFLSIAGNTSKAASFGIALGAAVLIAGAVTGVTAAAGGLAAFSGAVFPFAATAGTAAAFAALALFATVLIVVLAVLTAIIAGISVAEFAQIPGQLQTDVRNAASTTNTAQGKPNLATLITTDAGKQEIFLAFIETVGPEIDLSGRTAPAPENEPLWAVMDQNRTPLPTESGQLLTFTSWDDILGEAGLFGGWFVPQITQSGGATQNTLALGIEYVNSNGEQWTAWRTKCQDQTNAACTFGEAIFVHTRNGDEPPTGLSEAEFAAWFANASKEIAYKNGVGSSRIARLNRRPTATGIAVDGIQTEGQQLTFTGAASDPDNDAVNLAWNFGDGTSPVTGSPVQHAFADSGSLQVVLTPTDVFGASGTTKTQSITVANVAPTATLPTPTPVNEGFPFTLSLTNPSDPSTADTQAGFQYAFDCGSGFGSFSSSNTKSCPTVDNGAFPVAAKIKDKDGGENTYTATATVHNVAPSGALLFTTLSVPEGSSFAFSFLSFGPFDPSPVDTAAGFQFAFNCGNGFGEYSSTNGVTCSTTDNGTLSVAGRIKDKDDGVGERTGDINVTNVAPTATFTATPQIFLGESATLTFSQQSDPSSVDTAAGFTYTYDCTTNGTLNVANNRAASATCQYLTTGTFTVGGTISDKDQGANGYTASVTVISPQQAATNLKDQVVALNLSATRTSDLTTKIDNALQKLAQGKKDQASKQLQDFIKKVNDIVRQKLITAAQGQELIDIANRIIASIAVS